MTRTSGGMQLAPTYAIISTAVESEADMGEAPDQERQTVRLEMDELYREAVALAGETQAAALWSEHKLDSGAKWAGKWATAMEIVQGLREASSES